MVWVSRAGQRGLHERDKLCALSSALFSALPHCPSSSLLSARPPPPPPGATSGVSGAQGRWKFATADPVTTSLIVDGGSLPGSCCDQVYFVSGDGASSTATLHAVDVYSGVQQWSATLEVRAGGRQGYA